MRHDQKIIDVMTRHGLPEDVRAYKELPFLFLGDFSPADVKLPRMDEDLKEVLVNNERLKAVFPFEMFAVWVIDPACYDGGYPIVVRLVDHDDGTTHIHIKDITASKIGFMVYDGSFGFAIDESDGKVACVVQDCGLLMAKNGVVKEYPTASDVYGESIVADRAAGLSTTVTNLVATLRDAMDKHLVEVKTKPVSKAKAKALRKAGKPVPKPNNSTHYIFLDAPRYSNGGGASTGKGSPKRGHNRRGHWRKLTNSRFARHPQYGKTVWVRPAWIGPTDWTVGDTIYTVRDINVPQALH